MSNLFTFGFDGDSTENEVDVAKDEKFAAANKHPDLGGPAEPQLHSLEEMLSTLPSALNFTRRSLSINEDMAWDLPRRDFHDIKAQLMAEADELGPIPGITSEDLEPGIYEGGFKTWECSEDLSSYILAHEALSLERHKTTTVIELGAGTAQPTCSLLIWYLKSMIAKGRHPSKSLTLLVADFNSRVLEVATVPNLLLSAASALDFPMEGDYLEMSPSCKTSLVGFLDSKQVKISAISGGWSLGFAGVLHRRIPTDASSGVLILGSETVYAPETIRTFAETLMHILITLGQQGKQAKALIAMKKVYFGVGGGLNDFSAATEAFGGEAHIVWQSEDTSVGRAILAVTAPSP